MIQGSPSVIAFATFFALGEHATNMLPLIFLALWEMHYLQRTYIFPSLMRGTRRTLRLSVIAVAMLFYVINGYLNGRYLTQFSDGYSSAWLTDPRFVTGVIVFFTGMALNLHSDNILRNLRKPGEASYKIPRGGMFKFVSCGNYCGEIVQWCGWASTSCDISSPLVPRPVPGISRRAQGADSLRTLTERHPAEPPG
jgi:3-oxo-5-alpha-steroid 4-dehydrogenase 1